MWLRALLFATLVAWPAGASAARVLVVSDSSSDTEIADALRADGHQVDLVANDFATGNATLRGDLFGYDAVFWAASGNGSGDQHNDGGLFDHLRQYVERGGRVLVTGYDTIASPDDPQLIAFLGGSGSTDVPPAPGPVSTDANSLTTGAVDIRGISFSPPCGDRDTIFGLGADTIEVVGTPGGNGAQWTLRRLGVGEIAYVSNGDTSPSAAGSWLDVTSVYNAAIRNFAASVRPFERFVETHEADSVPHPRRGRVTSLAEGDRPAILMGRDRVWLPDAGISPSAVCGPSRCRPVRTIEHCEAPRCPGSGQLLIAVEPIAEVGDFPTDRSERQRELEAILLDADLRPLGPWFVASPAPGGSEMSFIRPNVEEWFFELALSGGAGYLVNAGVGLGAISASIGLRWTPRMNEPIRLLFGNILGLDARVTALPNVTGQRSEDVGFLLGIAPAVSYGLTNERIRLPATWAWLIPEVGVALRPDRPEALYLTWSLAAAVLLDPHVGLELRTQATLIPDWAEGGAVEAMLGATLGVLFR